MINAKSRDLSEAVVSKIESNVLKALEDKEDQLDEEIRNLEQASDDDLERLREQRLRELKSQAQQLDKLRHFGHGEYTEIDEKDFFSAAKRSRCIVAHFYRPTTHRCVILDKHFTSLSRKHVCTRFVKINAEKAPFLTDRLNIHMLPTIVLVKDGVTENTLVGFEAFGGTDTFATSAVESVLKQLKMVGQDVGKPLRTESDS